MPDDQVARPTRRSNELRWAILQEVQREGRVGVTELSARLQVSEVSIRRHLEQLEQAGLLRRVHGGAQAAAAPGQLSVFEARLLQNAECKQALGRRAAELIRPGQAVFLDSGTTVLEIARQLPRLLEDSATLTVLTRSLAIAAELRSHRRIRLIVVGGVYAHDFDDMVGPQVSQTLRSVHADVLFIGTDGVSAERGLTTDNVLEAGLYQEMARCAERVVVVTDSGKIGVTKVQTTLAFEEIHTFITDSGAPPEFVALLRERGVEVILISNPT
jgi:DeoR/GlpR family transcriptional regulator of sugar metabolism